jgi:hypothetical protein
MRVWIRDVRESEGRTERRRQAWRGSLSLWVLAAILLVASLPALSAQRFPSTISVSAVHLSPIVALIAGILILIAPRLLNYIVAFYLILIGLLGLSGR